MVSLLTKVLFLFLIVTKSTFAMNADDAKKIMQKSGCIACHDLEKDKIGPSYHSIGQRYAAPDAETTKYLAGKAPADFIFEKVRKGSAKSKNWTKSKEGKPFGVMTPTAANRISDDELKSLITYILSLK